MSLPDSVAHTIAATQRFSRGEFLAAQDWIAAMHQRGASDPQALIIAGIGGKSINGWAGAGGGAYAQSTGVSQEIYYAPRLPVGRRLRSLTARVFRNGATVMALTLTQGQYIDPTTLGSIGTITGGTNGAWADLTITLAYPYHRVSRGWAYRLEVSSGQSGDRVSRISFTWDRP